ncbi:hypothetical protein LCGC14_0951090 [marine sediment metagenome]|uniref:C2H2-type domain-containing protein n=1 Tax=marine sediment metagenome TaxID=412755 RepID=A0A0F9RNR2_9ZZZZ
MSAPIKYKCPYCDRESLSPGGVRFHIGSDHTDKVEEFKAEHYHAMKERYYK